ncbi:MAG: hypothetical protein WC044_08625 [Crocinitomicaceae bacterium]
MRFTRSLVFLVKIDSMIYQSFLSNDLLTTSIIKSGIQNWYELIDIVSKLPYGRNANRTDFSLVLTEQKGTCSSKHAFLKTVADLNQIPDVKLILGMYKMNEENTPGIGSALIENQLDYLPEAHCYLQISDEKVDFTSENSSFNRIKNVILTEIEIKPKQVGDWKVDYHKSYLRNWQKQQGVSLSFEDLWSIREKCIANLSLKKMKNQ